MDENEDEEGGGGGEEEVGYARVSGRGRRASVEFGGFF